MGSTAGTHPLQKTINGSRSTSERLLPQGSLTLYGGLKAPGWPSGISSASWQATAIYLAFLSAQIGLHLLLPGRKELGVPLRNGKQLTYKFTGADLGASHHNPVNEAARQVPAQYECLDTLSRHFLSQSTRNIFLQSLTSNFKNCREVQPGDNPGCCLVLWLPQKAGGSCLDL